MRFLLLMLLLIFAIACNGGGGSSSSGTPNNSGSTGGASGGGGNGGSASGGNGNASYYGFDTLGNPLVDISSAPSAASNIVHSNEFYVKLNNISARLADFAIYQPTCLLGCGLCLLFSSECE